MESIFFKLILGHLVGDYLLQNDWMAQNKKNDWFPYTIHSLIYTTIICLFLFSNLVTLPLYLYLLFPVLIFCSHYFIDRYEIIDWWYTYFNGRTKKKLVEMNQSNDEILKHSMTSIHWIVTIVADNTLHMLLMYLIILIIF